MHEYKLVGPSLFSELNVSGENYKQMLCYYAMPKMLHLQASSNAKQDRASSYWLGSL